MQLSSGRSQRAPQRIVSLVPSLTEMLSSFGLDEEVVGLTRFCIHPGGWKERKTIVGGTKSVNVERVEDLRADLVIANKEENTRPVVEAIRDFAPVHVTEVASLPDALCMIRSVGELTGKPGRASALADDVESQFRSLRSYDTMRVAYLIWKDPYMTVGGDTFIHDTMTRAGFENAFGHRERYPTVTLGELTAAEPDAVFLSTEPYPFDESHVQALQDELPDSLAVLVEGDLFSWYGSRLLEAPAYLADLQDELKAL